MAYYVDRNPEQENDFERNCEPCFPKFKKLKDARAYAKEHGDTLGALPILDKNGDTVPWPKPKQSKAELRAALQSANQIIGDYKEAVAGASRLREVEHQQASEEHDDHARRMLAAGYIPLDRLRDMTVANISGYSTDHGSYYTINLVARSGDNLSGDIMTAIIKGEYKP